MEKSHNKKPYSYRLNHNKALILYWWFLNASHIFEPKQVTWAGLCVPWERISSTCVISIWRNDRNCEYMFIVLLKKISRKGLKILNMSRFQGCTPDNKVHGANMGPTWVLSAPDGSHVGRMKPCYLGLALPVQIWKISAGTLPINPDDCSEVKCGHTNNAASSGWCKYIASAKIWWWTGILVRDTSRSIGAYMRQ